jgi:hypothetical protein
MKAFTQPKGREMLTELPINVQIRVIQYLAADNFPQAKRLHDQWLQDHRAEHATINAKAA